MPRKALNRFCYGGSETQDPRVAPLINTQEHAPLHGWVALQRPLHTPILGGLLRNCRAETVPAHSTLVTKAVRTIALILFMAVSFLFDLLSRPGCNQFAHAYGGSGLRNDARTAQDVGAACFLGAEAPAASLGGRSQRQLARGNRSRAQYACDQRHKERCPDFLVHEGSPFLFDGRTIMLSGLPRLRWSRVADAPAGGPGQDFAQARTGTVHGRAAGASANR